ncbi:unnamed protein product [Somion occarium]|uniref:Uncharacterized protein n=1 Tax=Somion occarium TaxID=3059160 RepID=A0ABP1E5F7_9APHY
MEQSRKTRKEMPEEMPTLKVSSFEAPFLHWMTSFFHLMMSSLPLRNGDCSRRKVPSELEAQEHQLS